MKNTKKIKSCQLNYPGCQGKYECQYIVQLGGITVYKYNCCYPCKEIFHQERARKNEEFLQKERNQNQKK